AVHPNGIGHQEELGPILIRHCSAVNLVPIEHKLALRTFGHLIAVYGYGMPVWYRHLNTRLPNWRPPCARKAVLWRVHGAPCPLAREICQEQVNGGFLGSAAVNSFHEIAVSQYFAHVRLNAQFGATPISYFQRE